VVPYEWSSASVSAVLARPGTRVAVESGLTEADRSLATRGLPPMRLTSALCAQVELARRPTAVVPGRTPGKTTTFTGPRPVRITAQYAGWFPVVTRRADVRRARHFLMTYSGRKKDQSVLPSHDKPVASVGVLNRHASAFFSRCRATFAECR
jgi:hypothetical protein